MMTKIKTLNKAYAPMGSGKVPNKTFRIAVVSVPVGARPGGGGLTVKWRHAVDQDFGAINAYKRGSFTRTKVFHFRNDE
jgi:hypothetical protein